MINVSGGDKPGVASAVASVLAEYAVNILDIGQAVIHDTLSLGILAQLPTDNSSSVIKEVLFRLHELGMQARFQAVSADSYAHWVAQQGKPQHIVTLLARSITAQQVARVTAIIAGEGLNIDQIRRLSGRVPLDHIVPNSKACIEFSVRGAAADPDAFRSALLELAAELSVDLAYQEDNIYRRHRRLVVFDMDSTLIEGEMIDELAQEAGVGEQVAAITAAAMAGEMDFQTSFRRRVGLLAGLDAAALERVAARLQLTEGAEHLITTLKKLGYRTAVLSGGFTYFGERIQRQLGIDHVFANELEIDNGHITGQVTGAIVDGQRKAEFLQALALQENIRLEQTIAVGDGANDLPMLKIAGLGIAFRAKPIVKASAKQAISTVGLDGILYLMGVRDRDTRI